ncbi:MAG TPA: type II toxin-antitoxin system VapC family toxin [Thermoplasmata archaeon]|nr:type II toxin-antitoxin system VapC family toxin [Thermoplasmata archaeon]
MGLTLDTSTLIELLADNPRVRTAIASHEEKGLVPVLSTVAAFEALSGVEYTKSRAERARLEALFRRLPLEEFTLDAARAAGELRADLRRLGRSPSAPDVMIAGQAIAAGHTLMTGDRLLARSSESMGLSVILVE